MGNSTRQQPSFFNKFKKKKSEKRTQSLKNKNKKTLRSDTKVTYMIPLYKVSRTGKSTQTESRFVIARGWEEEGMGNDYLKNTGYVLKLESWQLPNIGNALNASKRYALKWLIVCCINFTSIF